MITRDLKVKINMDEVFHRIDCSKDSDLYEEVAAEYREIEDQMYALCDPVFLMEYAAIGPELAQPDLPEGTPVLMVIYSIGRGISDYSTNAFREGDYLKGMLADAIADTALFSLEKEFAPYLKEACAEHRMGISRRLEAPQDISMLAQKIIFETTQAKKLCGMDITSGYMLDPLKSNAAVYVLTTNQELFLHQHNCRKCNRYDCKSRNIPDIPIEVTDGEKTYSLSVKENESILHALMTKDSSFGAVCGGTGRCGKCKIRVTQGYLPATPSDHAFFTEEALQHGMRLSCMAYPSEPLQIQLQFKGDADLQAVADCRLKISKETDESMPADLPSAPDHETFGIAADIGTTTIAIQLISLKSGCPLATYTDMNHQRNYGADVISRIKASSEGKKDVLRRSILQDLTKGIRHVVKDSGILPEQVTEVAIAGNTTMIHLLMGYDCKSLGEFPFTPVNVNMIEDTYESILEDSFLSARVRILPGISAFVGGDITAGLYICDVDRSEAYSLLIDLGTNGEIALGNRDKIIVSSTAAGPAFEGGNITWGTGSIEGAISGVTITKQGPTVRTINDQSPVGICGTGVIEAISELLKEGLIDETGCLDDEYFDDGYPLAKNSTGEDIVITQKDIREIQLAKSAVRAGVETLFLRYGIQKDEVSHVYLAGGFGYKLDCEKAIAIGMIPSEFAGKVSAIGNSSLGGAVKCLLEEDGFGRASAICQSAAEINLSADQDFNAFYVENMMF